MRSDKELLALIRERDGEAFEALLARYGQAIRRHLLRTVRDEGAAEDLLQEVFLRVWTRAEQWHGEGAVKGWLLRIATNLALNHLRALRRRPQQPLERPPGPDSSEETTVPGWMVDASALGPDALLEQAEQREQLRRGLYDLPEEKREVLRLVHDEELSLRDIAERLHIPEGTVKSRLHYAKVHLARTWKALEQEGEDTL